MKGHFDRFDERFSESFSQKFSERFTEMRIVASTASMLEEPTRENDQPCL